MRRLEPVQNLPPAAGGGRRWLAVDESGGQVEVAELGEARAARLPSGGVFVPVEVDGGRVVLAEDRLVRLQSLAPPPLVVVGLAERVLRDLETLHLGGGAHGAVAVEGWGFDATGTFRVRPVLARAPRDASPAEQDVVAVGEAVVALAGGAALVEAGLARAADWLRGVGVGRPRVGFADARAARQALRAAWGRAPVEETLAAWLRERGYRLPPPAPAFKVRGAPPAQARAWARERERASGAARDWVVAELERIRAERRAAREAEVDARRRAWEAEAEAEAAARERGRREAERRIAEREAQRDAERAELLRRRVDQAEEAARLEEEARRAAEEDRSRLAREAEQAWRAGTAAVDEVAEVEPAGDAPAPEAEDQAEAARRAEEQRRAEEAARRAEEQRRAEAARLAEEQRRAEEAERAAEAARRAEEQRRAEEAARLAEEQRRAEAARRAEAERAAEAARLAEEQRRAEAEAIARTAAAPSLPPAPAGPFEDEPPHTDPRDDDAPWPAQGGGGARWEGAAMVTGDPRRAREKGPGKWVESGRTREELLADLPEGPPRSLELTEASPPRSKPGWLVVVGVVAVLGILAWLALS